MTAMENITELEPIIVDSAPPAANSSNAAAIGGKAKWQTCWKQACYLSKYIYKDPEPSDGFHTQFPEKMAEAERVWEVWDELVQQRKSGLVARLFKVKGYDPNTITDICPPCLVFRGTDFDDFRDLAIVPTVTVLGYKVYDQPFILDKTIPANATVEDLVARGMQSYLIYEESEWVTIEAAQTVESASIGSTAGQMLEVPCNLKLEIYAKEDGDWANNIKQGLGKGSRQFKNAISYGRQVVDAYVRPYNDKRLEITGHSLGGGLASAVCAVLSNTVPGVEFHAMTFNPSGVHKNTISPVPLASGNTNVFSVKDEFLTTLQSQSTLIPILGSIFRFAKRTIGEDAIPEHLGAMLQVAGTSAGEPPPKKNPKPNKKMGRLKNSPIPPKGAALPVLFPISEQKLIAFPNGEKFPGLMHLDTMLSSSPSVMLFAEKLLSHINEKYREISIREPSIKDADKPFWSFSVPILDLYRDMASRYAKDLQPELDALMTIIDASVSYHGMDYVIATYEKAYGGL